LIDPESHETHIGQSNAIAGRFISEFCIRRSNIQYVLRQRFRQLPKAIGGYGQKILARWIDAQHQERAPCFEVHQYTNAWQSTVV